MKTKSIYHFIKTGIICLTFVLFNTLVFASDWHELNQMSESELSIKVAKFQQQLDQHPNKHENLKAIGIAYHALAIKDSKTNAPLAVKYLSAAYGQNKTDYVSLCYLGSAMTILAKTNVDYKQGIAYMDEAVRKAPNNVTIRLIRAYNSKRLPDFLAREHIALEDFHYLSEIIANDPSSYQTIKKEVYLNLTELYEKRNNICKW